MRVLLVDDNEELREFLELLLAEGQVEVVAAATAQAALAQVESQKFDVLIIDSVMPGEDGIALTQKIRATRAGRNVPILLMSSLSTALARRMAKDAGVNEFLVKPFGQMQLLEQVKNLGR
jgi:DNA-binding response OmpR family regulator